MSIGIVFIWEIDIEMDFILKKVDIVFYKVKYNGCNGYLFFGEECFLVLIVKVVG